VDMIEILLAAGILQYLSFWYLYSDLFTMLKTQLIRAKHENNLKKTVQQQNIYLKLFAANPKNERLK